MYFHIKCHFLHFAYSHQFFFFFFLGLYSQKMEYFIHKKWNILFTKKWNILFTKNGIFYSQKMEYFIHKKWNILFHPIGILFADAETEF